MLDRVSPFQIIRDNFCPFSHGVGRQFSKRHFASFAVLPCVGGVVLACTLYGIQPPTAAIIIGVYSIIAAVMTALLAVIHNVIGSTSVEKGFDAGDWKKKRELILQLEVLRELYANASYAVLILVGGLGPLVALLFDLPCVARVVLSGAVHAVSISVVLSFLSVITGIYLVLDTQAKNMDSAIRYAAAPSENAAQSNGAAAVQPNEVTPIEANSKKEDTGQHKSKPKGKKRKS